jgi:hypothetical protein
MQIQEDTVEAQQAVGNDRDQKEDFDTDDEGILKVPDDILVRHQPGGHATQVMIDCEMESQHKHQQGTGGDLEQPGPRIFARAWPRDRGGKS